MVNSRYEHVGWPQVINRGGRDATDQRQKAFVVVLEMCDGQHAWTVVNELTNLLARQHSH